MTTVCFTGHRPNKEIAKDKLGTGYSISNERVQAYNRLLHDTLRPLIQNEGVDTFISGGAIGVDQIAFWSVEHLKKEFPHIKNILAIPFEKQYTAWKNPEILEWYHKMFNRADSVVFTDTVLGYRDPSVPFGQYTALKMQLRNQYMVDHAQRVVCIWDGSSGGTGNCVRYAKKQQKSIVHLQPLTF